MRPSQIIKDTYLAYLDFLSNGGDRVQLPSYVHDPEAGKGKVYASSLCRCPLANARERNGVEKPFPLTNAERLSSLHLMQQGVRDAEPLQEALVWKFGEFAVPEMSVSSTTLRLRGRIDAFIKDGHFDFEDSPQIIEIKRRDSWGPENTPTPKLSDLFQVMAYGWITGVEDMHVITLDRYFITIWSLYPQDNGYVVENEFGERWNSPLNNPDVINMFELGREIERQLDYMTGLKSDIPYPDFLNHQDGWACYHWIEKPRNYKTKENKVGRIKRRCPFWCHGDEHELNVTIDSDGKYQIEPQL